jgi:hypothetical protein
MTADDSCGVSRNCHPPKTTLKTEILEILRKRIAKFNIKNILLSAHNECKKTNTNMNIANHIEKVYK